LYGDTQAVQTPCDGGTVTLASLEKNLLAWTLWELREERAIELDRVGRDNFFGGEVAENVTVRRLSSVPASDGQLAQELLTACTDESVSVPLLITVWGEQKGVDLKEFRYLPLAGLTDVVCHDVRRRLQVHKHRDDWVWPCDRVERLGSQFEEVASRWYDFKQQERKLANSLLRNCNQGLAWVRQPPLRAPSGGYSG
jgi:hypothetical protein